MKIATIRLLGVLSLGLTGCSKSDDKDTPAPTSITDPTINAADYQRCASQSVTTSLQAALTKTISNDLLSVVATAKLKADVSSATGRIVFDVSSSDVTALPEYALGTVVDKLNGTTGSIDLIRATDAEIEASGYLDVAGTIDCQILFVGKQVSKKDDGVQKIITYNPPLPFGILPQADQTELNAFFTAKSSFPDIVAKVTEVVGNTGVTAGLSTTGIVAVTGSDLDYTFAYNFTAFSDYEIAGLAKSNRFKVVSGSYTEVDMNYELIFPGSTTAESLNVNFR